MKFSTQLWFYIRATKETVVTILKSGLWFRCSPELQSGGQIHNNFFGINIAPSSDLRADDYIVARLKQLQIQNVRMDFSYTSLGGDAERLLGHVLAHGFRVMLDLLPPKDDAAILADDKDAQQRWSDFINTVAGKYDGQVHRFEIGATPNRGRWSGFELLSYLKAWQIASDHLTNKDILLAGPNVSDFEPISNIALLAEMQHQGHPPYSHTDNLFVERVIEPEAYDHRVLGQWATQILKLNLVKKIRLFHDLTQRYGAKQTICSYTCWTTKRLNRWSTFAEQKKADYLVRYLVIAATSGALDKVYWGPLIDSRDGLIDDGATGYPEIDNVSFYKEIRGEYDQFQPGNAFYTLGYLVQRLSGAKCVQAVSTEKDVNHFIFNTAQNTQLHISWTRDRRVLPLQTLYSPQQLEQAIFFDSSGQQYDRPVTSICEHPLFIQFDQPQALNMSADQMCQLVISKDTIYTSISDIEFSPWQQDDWNGAVAVRFDQGETLAEKAQVMMPDSLLSLPQLGVHRDQRNKVWSIYNPLNLNERLVVKQNRVTGIKKFTYRFRPSKGQRHWNNASEMIRRGVNSPTPIAYFERTKNAGITHNYYVCDYVADAFSARDAFMAFAQGELSYQGFDKELIFRVLADYICNMHNNKIIHYDMSGGNLLMTKNDAGQIDVTVIDIGRAAILKGKITEKKRMIDLARACYKLDWPNRIAFMQCYFDVYGKAFSVNWEKPLSNYDWKQRTKRKIKGVFKRKKRLKN